MRMKDEDSSSLKKTSWSARAKGLEREVLKLAHTGKKKLKSGHLKKNEQQYNRENPQEKEKKLW